MSIEEEIDSVIQSGGGNYRDWYIGLSLNPRERMFDGHNVSEKSGLWTHKDAGSEMMAREVEAFFLKKGCKGGGMKKDSSRHVYAYKMTKTTRG
jgi:hypothetical protein